MPKYLYRNKETARFPIIMGHYNLPFRNFAPDGWPQRIVSRIGKEWSKKWKIEFSKNPQLAGIAAVSPLNTDSPASPDAS
jgi:hypothetical protein